MLNDELHDADYEQLLRVFHGFIDDVFRDAANGVRDAPHDGLLDVRGGLHDVHDAIPDVANALHGVARDVLDDAHDVHHDEFHGVLLFLD